jgi:hypothetical protein
MKIILDTVLSLTLISAHIDSGATSPSYEAIQHWIDTESYPGYDFNDDELRSIREDERRYYRERGCKQPQIQPTLYPSPWWKRPTTT